MKTVTLPDIELAAEDFRAAYDRLNDLLVRLRTAQEHLVNLNIPAIRAASLRTKEAQKRLSELVETGRELFLQPKTRVMHGIEVGYRKQPDAYQFPPNAVLVAAIESQMPSISAACIEVEKRALKPPLKNLTLEQLQQIGVTVTPGVDAIVIKPLDGDVDKLIKALLGDKLNEENTDG